MISDTLRAKCVAPTGMDFDDGSVSGVRTGAAKVEVVKRVRRIRMGRCIEVVVVCGPERFCNN